MVAMMMAVLIGGRGWGGDEWGDCEGGGALLVMMVDVVGMGRSRMEAVVEPQQQFWEN